MSNLHWFILLLLPSACPLTPAPASTQSSQDRGLQDKLKCGDSSYDCRGLCTMPSPGGHILFPLEGASEAEDEAQG